MTLLLLLVTASTAGATPPPPSPSTFFPCRPGHAIEYRLSNGSQVVDTVRGPDPKRSWECIVDRVSVDASGAESTSAWVFETTADRVSDAGWLGRTTAFRPPYLVAPVKKGASWRFNRTDFVILEAGVDQKVPAGTFHGCVVVESKPSKGPGPVKRATYAPNVGLIRFETEDGAREAVRVTVAEGTTSAKSGAKPRK